MSDQTKNIISALSKIKPSKKTIKEILNDIRSPSSNIKNQALEAGNSIMCGCERGLNSHNHTYFSIMDGVSSPEDMVSKTAMRGWGGIGISDHGTMGGVLRAGKEGKDWYVAKLKDNQSLLVRKVNTKKYLKGLTVCDENWKELTEESTQELLSTESAFIHHNESENKKVRVIQPDLIVSKTPFKVLSGCELYVSWQKDSHKKYNHITVYATGMKGHRALVLLTSIGSIPSRRYIGARGFFRPRVFVEDIETALKEADGQLIVTTGCPISITSEAIREGRLDDARAFFQWGVTNVPRGNFYAELHLCDTSLDFNRNYVQAEDKFYSSVFGVPVARFRHFSRQEADDYAKSIKEDLNFYLYGVAVDLLSGTNKTIKSLSTITENLEKSQQKGLQKFTNSEIGLSSTIASLSNLLHDYNVSQNSERFETHKSATLKILKDALTSNEESRSDSEDTSGESSKSKKKKGPKKTQMDEDSFLLISEAFKVIETIEHDIKQPQISALIKVLSTAGNRFTDNKLSIDIESSKKLDASLKAYIIAQTVLYMSARIIEKENLTHINPVTVLNGFLVSARNQYKKNTSNHIKRDLGLSSYALGSVSDELSSDFNALIDLFASRTLNENLSAKAGLEDDIEKEWVISAEGNWMENVNRHLVSIAKEFDVPLLIATDSHMTETSMKDVQDAIIKRGKRRNWHMSRPYAIPRSSLPDFIEDIGIDWSTRNGEYIQSPGNCAKRMLDEGIITVEDLVEAFGSGAVINEMSTSCGEFSWEIVVPRIRYQNHRYYNDAVEILDSGALREFLPKPTDTEAKFTFTEKSINIATALIVATYFKEVENATTSLSPEYLERLHSELHLSQEVGTEQLADFFLVLQYLITRWRKIGISVGPGRGSSGGMLLANICGITAGDPIEKGFSQVRWMNRGRKAKKTPADIDQDVSDRQAAGLEFARVAKESFEDEVAKRPLSPLEVILHSETFFSSAPVTHEYLGGRIIEVAKRTKLASAANAFKREKSGEEGADSTEDTEGPDADDLSNLVPEDTLDAVFGTPIIRIGTYGSLKAKAAVKDAIRIADQTPFDELPPFGVPTNEWLANSSDKIKDLSELDIQKLYEEEVFGHLPIRERIARRRVKLGDRLTKEMTMGAGLARLYQSEYDFFMGSVKAHAPSYWDPGARPPSGSKEAADYFAKNPQVESLVIDMLNIFKNLGVHAGGLCFGREVFERVPVRADKHGYVSQFEMKWVEYVGVLKFDVLGLETLDQISETLKLIIKEEPYESLSKWIPKEAYEKALAGESTDLLWKYFPMSTKEAIEVICNRRAMTFQIDTKVFGAELDLLSPSSIISLVEELGGDTTSVKNDALVDVVSAFLALFRPGPMKLNSHKEYIRRMMGEPFVVIDPWLEKFVKTTLGVIAYQEQVMAVWSAGADGSEEETDDVRRAMGKKDIKALESIKAEERFLVGLSQKGVSKETAKSIWEMIVPFAEYGFNLSHSWHYALITCMTSFLKGHFPKYLFRVIMGTSKPEDLSRFLLEISSDTRMPCVLRSNDKHWAVIGDHYFPGLLSIDGIKKKDVERILSARERMLADGYGLDDITPFEWFCYMGPITESFATLISKSGIIRAFGTPEEIADGYKKAYLASFKIQQGQNTEKSDQVIEISKPDDELAGLELQELGSEKNSKTKKSNKTTRSKTINKATEKVINVLIQNGLKMVSYTFRDDSTASLLSNNQKMITRTAIDVESAVSLVVLSKTKGSGVRHLVQSLNLRENAAAQSNKTKPKIIIHLRELKNLERDGGARLSMGKIYRTVGLVRNLSSVKNYRTGEPETRVTFIAEGTDLSAKFSKAVSIEQIEEYSSLLKDEKMKIPFVVDVYVDSFTDKVTNRTIVYYKIENIEKVK